MSKVLFLYPCKGYVHYFGKKTSLTLYCNIKNNRWVALALSDCPAGHAEALVHGTPCTAWSATNKFRCILLRAVKKLKIVAWARQVGAYPQNCCLLFSEGDLCTQRCLPAGACSPSIDTSALQKGWRSSSWSSGWQAEEKGEWRWNRRGRTAKIAAQ